jgi:hypothetical protein
VLAKVRTHGFENFRQNRRGGVIVEVNAGHNLYYSTCFFVNVRFYGASESRALSKQGRHGVSLKLPGNQRFSIAT